MEYEEYLAKANSGAFQAASPGPPSGKTIAGKRGENITTLLPSSAFQRAMAEQTMVALLWQQGDARGTLNLPASTKVEDLKPFLSSWSGSFILWFNIGFEIPRPTLTSTLLQLVVTGTAWVVRSEVVLAVAHSTVLVLLSGIGYVPVLSREILLWRAAYLASLGACLWVMRAGARHLLWCILGSQGAKHAALASCGVAGKPC